MTAAAVSPYAWAGTPAYLKGIEARIVRKVMRALSAAGNPVIAVWDGEEETQWASSPERAWLLNYLANAS